MWGAKKLFLQYLVVNYKLIRVTKHNEKIVQWLYRLGFNIGFTVQCATSSRENYVGRQYRHM